jgi:hypothetical protein
VVRSLDLLCQRHLAADAADGFSVGEAVSFLEAGDLCFTVGGDHDNFIHARVYAGFKEERHVIDDYGLRIISCSVPR